MSIQKHQMTVSPYAGEFSRMPMDLGYEESASRLKQYGRSDEIPCLDISRALLVDERFEMGVAYSGMCLISLPHKKLPDDQVWKRLGHDVALLIEPGTLLINGEEKKFSVPYGARARMILIYLMSEAYRTKSREIRLGGSQRRWFEKRWSPFFRQGDKL